MNHLSFTYLEEKSVVCVSCGRLRVNGEWTNKKAGKGKYKFSSKVICPDYGPQNCEQQNKDF